MYRLYALLVVCMLASHCPALQAQIILGRANQNQDWVAMWAFNGRTDDQVRKQLDNELQMRIGMVDRLCELDDGQEAKLSRSAQADITRFFRQVTKIREEVKESGLNANNNQDMNKLWQIISPLTIAMQQGVFGENSLFQKVLRGTLEPEQSKTYKDALKKNRERRWKTLTRVNVAEIEKSTPLIGDQREKLLAILDKQEIPEKFNKQMDGYVGYLKLMKARKEDPTLGGFLDKHQLAVMNQYCDRYQGWMGMLQ